MELLQSVGGALWSWPLPLAMAGAGLVLGVRFGWPQLRPKFLWRETFGAPKTRGGGVTPVQTLCTGLGATAGTGNIVGVALAVEAGGPGTVFWLWVSAVLGMGVCFAENALAVRWRRQGGGPMYYLRCGLCGSLGKALGAAYALGALCACLAMGAMVQSGAAADAAFSLLGAGPALTGAALAVGAGFAVSGGLRRVARVSQVLLPAMAGLYLLGCFAVLLLRLDALPGALALVTREAFSLRSFSGGLAGSAVAWGFRRGVFSNEAGLGTSTMILSAAEGVTERGAGCWGAVQVCGDTLVGCSATVLCLLVTGEKTASAAFGTLFGPAGEVFVDVCLLLFAVTTVLGCSVYGETAWGYLRPGGSLAPFRLCFAAAVFCGAAANPAFAWALADAVNAVLALTNLTGVLLLTKNRADGAVGPKDGRLFSSWRTGRRRSWRPAPRCGGPARCSPPDCPRRSAP